MFIYEFGDPVLRIANFLSLEVMLHSGKARLCCSYCYINIFFIAVGKLAYISAVAGFTLSMKFAAQWADKIAADKFSK
jgi:hypothetical protein